MICANVKKRGCEDEKMICVDVKMGRGEDVKIYHRPPLLEEHRRTLRSDALGKTRYQLDRSP